jgi:hypothetical protein
VDTYSAELIYFAESKLTLQSPTHPEVPFTGVDTVDSITPPPLSAIIRSKSSMAYMSRTGPMSPLIEQEIN